MADAASKPVRLHDRHALSADRRHDLLAVAALIGWVFFLYRDSFAVYFLNEDFTHLWHCRFGSGKGVWALLTQDVLAGSYSWKPALQLWFALNYAAWGMHPWGYRFVTLLWHALAVCALYAVGTRGADRVRGLIAAAIFAAHPLHVESLSWTCAAAGVMSSACVLLATLAFLRWRAHEASAIPVVMLFALALLTHESAIVFPALAFSADVLLPGRRPSARRRMALYAAAGGVIMGFMLLRHLVSPAVLSFLVGLDPRWPVTPGGLLMFLMAKLRIVAALLLTLGPGWAALSLPLVAAATLAAGVLWRSGRPLALLALLWMGIVLAPFILLLLGPFPRYLYLVLAGFGLLVAELAVVAAQLGRGWGRAATACIAAVLVLWMVHVVSQIEIQESAFVARGNTTRALLADLLRVLPDPRPRATLSFYGLGDLRTRDGVFVYGLEDAVRLFYQDETLQVEFRALSEPAAPGAYRLWYHDGRLGRLDSERK